MMDAWLCCLLPRTVTTALHNITLFLVLADYNAIFAQVRNVLIAHGDALLAYIELAAEQVGVTSRGSARKLLRNQFPIEEDVLVSNGELVAVSNRLHPPSTAPATLARPVGNLSLRAT